MKFLKKINNADEMKKWQMSSSYAIPNLVLNNEIKKVQYNVPKIIGIFIQHSDSNLYTIDEWADGGFTNEQANGVAVVSDKCSFVIAKTEKQYASWQNTSTLIEGIATFTSKESAITDFDGANNTDIMTNSISKTYCSGYTFPNGQQGYLGSAGEWNELLKNYDVVNSVMISIGGEPLNSKKFWTSTQESQYKAWVCMTITKSIYADDKTYYSSVMYARPFGKI